mmetsp:Transcript_1021/g.3172  ORF Transcript_1021/g.3172 Transcript_1021/m.3172 type:complete len:254 (+) Transcript_1021:183-944(+)
MQIDPASFPGLSSSTSPSINVSPQVASPFFATRRGFDVLLATTVSPAPCTMTESPVPPLAPPGGCPPFLTTVAATDISVIPPKMEPLGMIPCRTATSTTTWSSPLSFGWSSVHRISLSATTTGLVKGRVKIMSKAIDASVGSCSGLRASLAQRSFLNLPTSSPAVKRPLKRRSSIWGFSATSAPVHWKADTLWTADSRLMPCHTKWMPRRVASFEKVMFMSSLKVWWSAWGFVKQMTSSSKPPPASALTHILM